jgi:hypothetical protein
VISEAATNPNFVVEVTSTKDDDGKAVTKISDEKEKNPITIIQ